eukprot:CFRG1097T1
MSNCAPRKSRRIAYFSKSVCTSTTTHTRKKTYKERDDRKQTGGKMAANALYNRAEREKLRPVTLVTLPKEIRLYIFQHLDPHGLQQVGYTSKLLIGDVRDLSVRVAVLSLQIPQNVTLSDNVMMYAGQEYAWVGSVIDTAFRWGGFELVRDMVCHADKVRARSIVDVANPERGPTIHTFADAQSDRNTFRNVDARNVAYACLYRSCDNGDVAMVYTLLHNRGENGWILRSVLPSRLYKAYSGLWCSEWVPLDASNNNSLALRVSALRGHTDVVRVLLKNGRVDPGEKQNQALYNASFHGHTEVVKLLLESDGVNPMAEGNRAFLFACRKGNTEIIRLFLKDRRMRLQPHIRALGFACRGGHVDAVDLLLKDGRCDPTARTSESLRFAVHNRNSTIVELLLADGRVDPSAMDNYCIRAAAISGDIAIVMLLLSFTFPSTIPPVPIPNEPPNANGNVNANENANTTTITSTNSSIQTRSQPSLDRSNRPLPPSPSMVLIPFASQSDVNENTDIGTNSQLPISSISNTNFNTPTVVRSPLPAQPGENANENTIAITQTSRNSTEAAIQPPPAHTPPAARPQEVSLVCRNGFDILYEVVRLQLFDIADMLLSDRRCDPARLDYRVLMWATMTGCARIVELFIKEREVIDQDTTATQRSSNIAERNGLSLRSECVTRTERKRLVDPSFSNNRLLKMARSWKQANVVELLLRNANVREKAGLKPYRCTRNTYSYDSA